MIQVILDLFGRSRLPSRDLLERSVQVLLSSQLCLKHRLNPVTLLCRLEDNMGTSSEDLRGKAFINGVINFLSIQMWSGICSTATVERQY